MTDTTTIRIVVLSLAVIALASLAGVIWLVHGNTDAAAVALVGSPGQVALGALAGVLVSTRSQPDPTVAAAVDQAVKAGAAQTEAAVRSLG